MMKALAVLLVLAMKQLNHANGSPKMFLVETKGGRTETSQTQKGGVFLFDVVVAEVPVGFFFNASSSFYRPLNKKLKILKFNLSIKLCLSW